MSVRLALAIFCICATIGTVWSQGFSGLGSTAKGFEVPDRSYALQFPKDHGAHDKFRIEWWYVTGNLQGEDGNTYGIQWTLFRSALKPGSKPGWSSPQLWMGHAAVTSAKHHYVSEVRARGGTGQAGTRRKPFEAWINDWSIIGNSGVDDDALNDVTLSASGADFRYNLQLKAQGPLVLQGAKGFSVKSGAGQASYYYSQPFYEVSGVLELPQGSVRVSGKAWFDHEWSSQPLANDQTGWDWISLHFDSGEKLMGFQLRQTDGSVFTSATWISTDGTTKAYSNGALKMTALLTKNVAGRAVPTQWRVELPDKTIDLTIKALNPASWMKTSIAYWEGPIVFSGTSGGSGYLEMTGY